MLGKSRTTANLQNPNEKSSRGKDFVPSRRPLRPATRKDRILIHIFVFVVFTILTGCVYLWVTLRMSIMYFEVETPLSNLSGITARWHVVIVSLTGGCVAVLGYVLLSFYDPYGSEASEKKLVDEKAKKQQLRAEADAYFKARRRSGSNDGE